MKVLTEDETIDALLAGASIARFGDGEFKIARGGAIKSQEDNPKLAAAMKDVLKCNGDYLVGIPRVTEKGAKNDFWTKFMLAQREFIVEGYQYGSSLITRPDSAPWIDNKKYWNKVLKLWKGKHAVLVWGGSNKSITPGMMFGARRLDIVEGSPRHAWREKDRILAEIDELDPKPEVAVMCLGPTATALVPELVRRGIQALDLGHIGAWLRPLFKSQKEFAAAHGFWWPGGAEEYGKRYVRRAQHLDKAIKMCPKRRSVVQAGGHVGVWPKYLANHFMSVYTFEPEYMNFTALNRNVPERHVFKMQAALGYERERVNLVIHPANIGGHHIKGDGFIPQIRIDDLGLKDCDLIVLDIEGSELDAIRGAEKTINLSHPVLHLELKGHIEKYKRGSTEDLVALLHKLGYEKRLEIGDDSIFTHR